MTNITLTHTKKMCKLEVDGHAGDSSVCTAISAIVCGISSLLETTDTKGLTLVEEVTLGSGHSVIRFIPRLPLVGDLIADTIIAGLKPIADEYPQFATFNLAL